MLRLAVIRVILSAYKAYFLPRRSPLGPLDAAEKGEGSVSRKPVPRFPFTEPRHLIPYFDVISHPRPPLPSGPGKASSR